MLDNEKTAELKRNCELLLEFIELINELSMQVEVLRKDKQYYMDEYKKTSDALHKLRSEINFKDKEKDLFPERLICENKQCRHNVRGSCQSEKITIGVDGGSYCKMSEDKLTNEELMQQAFSFLNQFPKIDSYHISDENGTYVTETYKSKELDTVEDAINETREYIDSIIKVSEKIWLRVFPELRENGGKYSIRMRMASRIR